MIEASVHQSLRDFPRARLLGGGKLLLEGSAVPVMLITVESPFERSPLGWSDRWMSRLTYAWAWNGGRSKVACDVARDVELKAGEDGHKCWFNDTHRCDECKEGTWAPGIEYCALKVATYYSGGTPICFFLVLQRSRTAEGAWERIGMGKISSDWGEPEAGWELFREAEIRKFRIV
jgi:hypothetical protein